MCFSFIFDWYKRDYLFLSPFDMSVIILSFCALGNLWLGVNHGGGGAEASFSKAIDWRGNIVRSCSCFHQQPNIGFSGGFLVALIFYFEWPTGQDVLRERDDVLKFFYLTEKWNMRRPPAGELLALPSEAWNAVHKEFQKIFKTRRKNEKCSGSRRGTERRAVKKEGGIGFFKTMTKFCGL